MSPDPPHDILSFYLVLILYSTYHSLKLSSLFTCLLCFLYKIVNFMRPYNLPIYLVYHCTLSIKHHARHIRQLRTPTSDQSARWSKRRDRLRKGVAWGSSGPPEPRMTTGGKGQAVNEDCWCLLPLQPVSKFRSGIFMLRQGKNKYPTDL